MKHRGKTPSPPPAPLLPVLQPLRPRLDLPALALLFVAALLLYALSTPRTVMLEDDGSFITAAWFAGTAHPPGYPFYILLGWLSSHLLPFGSVAWRVHALSGLMGALTCTCIAWLVLRRTGSRPAAWIAGAAFAVSDHFWSQAIIADVYTTNTAVLFLTLALVQEAVARRSTRLWLAAAAVYGLGLANHYPLLILGSPLLLACILAARRDLWRRAAGLLAVVVLVPALLYGWMVWRSQQALPVSFLGPIDTWGDVIRYLNRGRYAHTDSSVNAGVRDKLLFLRYFLGQALWQFSPLGFALALWGGVAAWRRGRRMETGCELLALCASSVLLIALLGFDYEYLRLAILRPYLLVAYAVLALWLGYGVHALGATRRARQPPGAPLSARVALPAFYGACAVIIIALGVYGGRTNYRPHDDFARQQALALLDMAAPNAVLVVEGDALLFPAAYLHTIENVRPDLDLLHAYGLVFERRVVRSPWNRARKNAAWAQYFKQLSRPAYLTGNYPKFADAGYSNVGFLKRGDRSIPRGAIRVKPNEQAKQLFIKLATMPPPKDTWIAVNRHNLMRRYGLYLGLGLLSDSPEVHAHIADLLPLAEGNYWSLVGIAFMLQHDPRQRAQADAYMQQAVPLATAERNKQEVAFALFVQGWIEQTNGNAAAARHLFRESLRHDRSDTNAAHRKLKELDG